MQEIQLSDKKLWDWFGMPNCPEVDKQSFHYAIQPYIDNAEYEKDKQLMAQYNSSSNPQDKFLMIMAAKVERTDDEILKINQQ